jgi:hypothetical protein
MVFFQEIHEIQQCSWIGLSATNWDFHHHKNSELEELFLSKCISILTGNNVLDAAASNMGGFLCRDTCISSN